MKAIIMLSGGLDSRLAMKMMLDQGIELHAYNHTTAFCTCTSRKSCKHEAVKAAEEFDIPLEVVNVTQKFLRVIESPEHGYGSGVNPCLDCRIMLFRGARELMEKIGARFVVTGEVLGERPMSQRREAMDLIEREAGLEGKVVRPLCAQAMDPTIPEEKGWVDRKKMKRITGRRRVPQMELAEEIGIGDYPCPAGGCRLTDPGYAARMEDLLEYAAPLSVNDVQLLKFGRHFRLADDVKVIVGRDEEENKCVDHLARDEDYRVELAETTGPLTLVRGRPCPKQLQLAGAITVRYSSCRDEERVPVVWCPFSEEKSHSATVRPVSDTKLESLRICC